MSVPDVLGFKLDEALGILAQQGWTSSVVTTYPPRRASLAERETRVVRVRISGEQAVELVVVHEGMGEGCSVREPASRPDL
ncbi:MAG: hypothetical protein C4575_11950 [Desulforudis sp.]|jgi:hypothetical protein|nr:MAG: hypothetical protein C4575_11950 [Desulforudis sp.]